MKATTIKATIKTTRKTSNNECQVYIRVTHDRQSQYIPTGIMILSTDFDNVRGICKEVFKNNQQKVVLHKQYNALLSNLIIKYES